MSEEEYGGAKPNYGNWDSWKLLSALAGAEVVLFILSFFLIYFLIGAAAFLLIFVFFAYARYMLSPHGGNQQAKLWDEIIQHLEWNGDGRVIDIGCGSGAVSIRLAKKYPAAQILGLDSWGGIWEYSKAMCERNAKIEKVSDRISFQKGDAAELPFKDGFFDAAVSNDTFHNVGRVKDKMNVIKEALRVVKSGGSFAFQDMFTTKLYYPSGIDELLQTIKSWGVKSVSVERTWEHKYLGYNTILIWGIK